MAMFRQPSNWPSALPNVWAKPGAPTDTRRSGSCLRR